MKAQTVEQFKILEYLRKNFDMGAIRVELVDRSTIRVMDSTGATLVFRLENDQVIWGSQPLERENWK